jgi:hypothetical protein
MHVRGKKKIVLLGMMTRIPVAGAVWGTMQYLIGFQRLGYDVYYVEAHARTPTMLMERDDDDSSAKAAAFLDRVMRYFDLGNRWAFHALHDDGRCYGLSDFQLKELYQSADLIINFHGGTVPLPEHSATGRLIYLETDPVELQIELYNHDQQAIEFLEPHVAFFSWGLNYGHPDCKVPLPERFHFRRTYPVVVCDHWSHGGNGEANTFTTIGNWRQFGQVHFNGDVYYWSKHHEFLKFVDLPVRTAQAFELALSRTSHTEEDKQLLENNGWRIRDSLSFSHDIAAYRDYIVGSRGEFTVAKDQNIRLRSGWFSERSAQYLAAGRPVITQETGFSNALPTCNGLFAFSTMDEILAALGEINSDYQRHCNAAQEIARAHFNYDVVLPQLLNEVGT